MLFKKFIIFTLLLFLNASTAYAVDIPLVEGDGITVTHSVGVDATVATDSTKANFIKNGALVCGASTAGKALVHTTPLQYCDNTATPALRYAAFGAVDGDALAGDSATAFFDAGIVEVVRGGTGVTTSTGTGSNVLSTSPILVTPALGTPSALVGTNITGTGAGFTAGNVTTNANLTGPITSSGNATSIASQTGTGTTFVVQVSPSLTTPNLGTPSALVATNVTGIPSGAYNAASIDGDDITSSIAGDGLILTVGTPDILNIDLNATLDGVGLTSSLSGLEFTATSELALLQGCADNQLLDWNDAAGTWDCATVSGGAGTYSKEFSIHSGKLTGGDITNSMRIDAGERPWSGRFEDTISQEVTFQWQIDPNYAAGTATLQLDFSMETTQTGSTNVKFDAKIMCVTGSTDAVSWDSDSFAAVQTVTHALASNQTADFMRTATITFTQAQADAMAVGDTCRIHISRDTAVASDATGDAKIATLLFHE